MLEILQARLKQYVNRELPDVQTGFTKGRGTRDHIANIPSIIEKAREFQKNIKRVSRVEAKGLYFSLFPNPHSPLSGFSFYNCANDFS